GNSASASGVYHASAPLLPKNSMTARFNLGSLRGLPHLSQRKTAMGTPHRRCLEMHQSGRVAIMLAIRSSPHDGSHFTFFTSSSDCWRNVLPPIGVSIEMNHCSVARKMIGLWQRQQCGYECSSVSVWSRTPLSFNNWTMGLLASKTFLPSYSGRPL